MRKSVVILTRVIGLLLIFWAVYAYVKDEDCTSTYNAYNAGRKEVRTLTLSFWKIGIVGLLAFFYKEIRRYLDYVKNSRY